jgi:23S rRNA pseudouridine1911/1915/1917 synthase
MPRAPARSADPAQLAQPAPELREELSPAGQAALTDAPVSTPLDTAELPEEDGVQQIHFEIKHDLQKRIDLYLRDRLPDYSRSAIQKIVKAGAVLVNGRPAKSSTVLRANDVLDVTLPRAAPDEALPENIPLDIVYEDEGFIAINKQAKLIVHPARGHWTGTLINALLWHAKETQGTLSTGSDPWRPGIIHRLDRDTTGLILVAKTDEAHWRLAGQFERRTIKKTYLAIVHGELELDSDLIDAPLGVHPHAREKYAVRHDGGGGAKPAQTVYTVAERFAGFTLVELAPKTGRTHQLRVHMAHIGHPIVGDYTYGGRMITPRDILPPSALTSPPAKRSPKTQSSALSPQSFDTPLIERQALHAYRLQFVHPLKFHRMHLEAKPPEDMVNIAELLRMWRKK